MSPHVPNLTLYPVAHQLCKMVATFLHHFDSKATSVPQPCHMQTCLQNSHKIATKNRQMSTLMWADTPILHCKKWYAFFALQKTRIISTSWGDVAMMFPVCYKPMALPWRFTCGHANGPWVVYHGHSPQPNWRFAMNMVILGAKITMPTHKPKVYWKLRSSAHQKDTPGCDNDQSATPACKQKMRIIFCTAKNAYQLLWCGCHFFA